MRLLIIDDNPTFASLMQRGLRQHGYVADTALTASSGERMAQTSSYDMILLDLKLPDRDGREVCRSLRRRGVQTKILMVTAMSGSDDTIDGLDAGADGYLAKPFDFDELCARIRSMLRRGVASESDRLRYADLELNLRTRTARRHSRAAELPLKEFMVLELLMRHPEEVVRREFIAERVYGNGLGPSSNVIDVYIASLRRQLDHGFDRPLIHTVTGVGYRLSASTRVSEAVTSS